jgi:hypothetical protein
VNVDTRGRLHLIGVALGLVVAIWAAVQGDWRFAVVFGVASVLLGAGVIHRIRQSQGDR